MKVAITGAAGGIGSVVADLLHSCGIELVLLDDLSSGSRSNFSSTYNKEQMIEIDLLRYDEVQELLEDCSHIVHLAAMSSLPECQANPTKAFNVNVGITASLIRIAIQKGVKIIFASTSAVYENNIHLPFRESDNVNPILTYSQTKYFSELMLNSASITNSIEYISLRFFNVFGPRQNFHRANPPLINYLVREILMNRNPTIYAPLSQARDYVYVGDIAQLIFQLITRRESLPNKNVNVCSGVGITIGEIVSSLEKAFGKKIEVNKGVPENLWERQVDLFTPFLPFNKSAVRDETLKVSIGDPSICLQELEWHATTNILSQIETDLEEMKSIIYRFI